MRRDPIVEKAASKYKTAVLLKEAIREGLKPVNGKTESDVLKEAHSFFVEGRKILQRAKDDPWQFICLQGSGPEYVRRLWLDSLVDPETGALKLTKTEIIEMYSERIRPSLYDCTRQEYTGWMKVVFFPGTGRYALYEGRSVDV